MIFHYLVFLGRAGFGASLDGMVRLHFWPSYRYINLIILICSGHTPMIRAMSAPYQIKHTPAKGFLLRQPFTEIRTTTMNLYVTIR